MTKYRHYRSMYPDHAFPNPIEPGEIAVNTANLQIAVGDADTASPGVPLPLLAIRFWTTHAQYTSGAFVTFGSKIYQSLVDIPAGAAFNPTEWRDITGIDLGAPPNDSKLYGVVNDGTSYVWVESVRRGGDTMTGTLLLKDENPPPDPLAAVPKRWVEKVPIAFPVVGKPIANVSLYIPVVMPITIPASLTGTIGFANVAPTANAAFTLNKIAAGGTVTALGTITAQAGSKTGFVVAGAGGALAIGEILHLQAPATQDATMADIGITLLALRA